MVVHDFAYAEVCFDGYKPPSILEVPGAKDVAIEFTLALEEPLDGGLARRLRARATARWSTRSRASRATSTTACRRPIQIGAIVALRGPQDCVAENCDELPRAARRADRRPRRSRATGAWKIEKPLGDDVRLGADPRAVPRARLARVLEAAARARRRSRCRPGIGFGENGEGYVRFALVENEHRIRQAVRGIRGFLRDAGA